MNYWDDLERHRNLDANWMNHPLVRRRINRRVTGDEHVWPITWLRSTLASRLPFQNALSIGCGIGNLERDLLAQGVVSGIVGIDVSRSCVAEARQLASCSPGASYEVAEARDFLRQGRGFDAVFFHGSLHHLDRVDEVMQLTREALVEGGLLYLDEYIGPSRFEWRWKDLLLPNAAYRLLPRSVRRVGIVRNMINHDDPTEAVDSSSIVPAIERWFQIVERRDYGGNLTELIYGNLRRPNEQPASPPEEFDRSIELLLDLEEGLLRHAGLIGKGSFHTVIVARRGSG